MHAQHEWHDKADVEMRTRCHASLIPTDSVKLDNVVMHAIITVNGSMQSHAGIFYRAHGSDTT